MLVVQSKKSDKLHIKTCESVQNIQDKNWIEYQIEADNIEEYQRRGYDLCKHCITKEIIEKTKKEEIQREHTLNLETQTMDYQRYIHQTNADPNIILHDELLEYLVPNNLYLYTYDYDTMKTRTDTLEILEKYGDRVIITSEQPLPIETKSYVIIDEQNIMQNLRKMNIISDKTETLTVHLHLNQTNVSKTRPLITITAQ